MVSALGVVRNALASRKIKSIAFKRKVKSIIAYDIV